MYEIYRVGQVFQNKAAISSRKSFGKLAIVPFQSLIWSHLLQSLTASKKQSLIRYNWLGRSSHFRNADCLVQKSFMTGHKKEM